MPTIFYSWQSDLPNSTNRGFIRKALDGAVEKLSSDLALAVEDSLRVDQDTQGVTGTPHIAETIFAKIAAADVFVADVSFVAHGKDGRRCPNPNVLIELGYALAKLGPDRVMMVMNVAYGPPSELPFDLKYRRFPIRFELPEVTASELRKDQREGLINTLVAALSPIVQEVLVGRSRSTPASQTRFDEGSTFADPSGSIEIDIAGDLRRSRLEAGARMFVCLAPIDYREPLDRAEAFRLMAQGELWPLNNEGYDGGNIGKTEWGPVRFSWHPENRTNLGAIALVQLDKVIWGIDTWLLDQRNAPRRARVDFKFIPDKAIIQRITNFIRRSGNFLSKELSYNGKVMIRFGVFGVKGYKLTLGHEHYSGIIFDNYVIHESLIIADLGQDLDNMIDDFAKKLRAASGTI